MAQYELTTFRRGGLLRSQGSTTTSATSTSMAPRSGSTSLDTDAHAEDLVTHDASPWAVFDVDGGIVVDYDALSRG